MKTKVFQILDFDRTLFDTSQFTKLITNEVDKISLGAGTILDDQFEAAYKNGETFFVLRHLRKEYGDDWFEELVASVVDKYGAERFFLPGFAERLAFAGPVGGPEPTWGILTYGDKADQAMKLRVAGLESVPTLLTTTPDKGLIIASWQQEDGSYQLPEEFGGHIVDTVTFEDDKLRAFRDMPSNALGIWMTNDEKSSEQIMQAGFTNVVAASDLFASIDIIENS